MIIKSQADAALERVRRMIDLYGNQMVTEGTLFGAVLDAVPAAPITDVVRLLPTEIQLKLREWAAALPELDDRTVIFWPISDESTVAVKTWLQENPA